VVATAMILTIRWQIYIYRIAAT